MSARLRQSATWNGPASPLRARLRKLAGGLACLAVYGALASAPGTTPGPAELLASAGLLMIVIALLPESAPAPLPASMRQGGHTTRGEWLQMAFNVGAAVLFVLSLVLVGTDRAGTRVLLLAVSVGLVCACVNHFANERRGDRLPTD